VAKNLNTRLGQQFQNSFKIVVVENLARRDVPETPEELLSVERKAGDDHLAHAVLGALVDLDSIGDSVSSVVKLRLRIELGVQISVGLVGGFGALPPALDSHAVGDFTGLDTNRSVKRAGGKGEDALPVSAIPQIYLARSDGDDHLDCTGIWLLRIHRDAH